MGLNRFLFTSDQNVTLLELGLGGAEEATRGASDSLGSFASSMFDTASDAFKVRSNTSSPVVSASGPFVGGQVGISDSPARLSINPIGVGAGIAGGFASVGQGVTGGLSYLFKKLKENAKEVLFEEMYVNPDSFDISFNIPVSKVETAGGVVINTWRPELPEIRMSGIVGWIRDESILNSAVNDAVTAFVGGQNIGSAFAQNFSGFGAPGNSLSALQRFREESRKLVNSPRKFLQSLKELALSPMYYVPPGKATEQYNNKKIIAFTKAYPEGIVFEGYFTNFSFKETGKDPETIRYDLSFVATSTKPIGISERIGQFIAPFYGTALEVGSIGSNLLNAPAQIASIF